ncbi:MAG TPA: site-specific integrase [Polyangiaceae bacterium]|nr:site-specific integrase [Polyangiaceae bacterium]
MRAKTRKKRPLPETHAIAEAIRPWLAAWHERQGSPTTGPVFPVRRGPRAGESKARSNMSYARRLRRELRKAGVDRHGLHNETPTTKPTVFHTLRGAFATALARVGANAQLAMSLTGHADSKVHRRYLDQETIRQLPAAVPAIGLVVLPSNENRPKSGAKPETLASPNSVFSGAGHEARTRDPELGKVDGLEIAQESSGNASARTPGGSTFPVASVTRAVLPVPVSDRVGGAAVWDEVIRAWCRARAQELATEWVRVQSCGSSS